MNYIELINNFWELDEYWQFTCCETRLYFYLIKTANRLGWVDNWTHSDAKAAANVGVSINTLKTARNKLIQSGLIEYKSGGKFRGDKNRYQIRCQNLPTKPHTNLHPNLYPNLAPKPIPLIKHKLNKLSSSPKKEKADSSSKGEEKMKLNEKEFVEGVVKYFNDTCKNLKAVKIISSKRRQMILARYHEHGEQGRSRIRDVILNASKSNFLGGQNKGGFTATFDWLFRPENFIKTLEGNYDNREKQARDEPNFVKNDREASRNQYCYEAEQRVAGRSAMLAASYRSQGKVQEAGDACGDIQADECADDV